MNEWQALTRRTRGEPFLVERVRLVADDVAIEGSFLPPALAVLPAEDQDFVAAFVRAHGSIKAMEKLFGVSYPTIKGRLNRIASRLPGVETYEEPPRNEVLDELEAGRIDVTEALRRLES